MTLSNPVWDNTRKVSMALKAIGLYLTAVYLVWLQRISDRIGDHDDPDVQDLKRIIFWGLRFIPVICLFVPGVPVTYPIGWYGVPFVEFLISLV